MVAPPYSEEIEYAAIGTALLSVENLDDVLTLAPPGKFFGIKCRQVLKAAIRTREAGGAYDPLAIYQHLESNTEVTYSDLAEWMGAVPNTYDPAYYAGVVAADHDRRRTIQAMHDGLRAAHDRGQDPSEMLAGIRGSIDAIADGSTINEPVSMLTAMAEWTNQLGQDKTAASASTGLSDLDALHCGGLRLTCPHGRYQPLT